MTDGDQHKVDTISKLRKQSANKANSADVLPPAADLWRYTCNKIRSIMKTSDKIKKILAAYNISEKEKLKLEKELQEYIDKRIKEIAERQRMQWSEKMKKLAREELMKMIESKKEKKRV